MLESILDNVASLLPPETQQQAVDAALEVTPVIAGMLVLMLVCEVACYRSVQALWQQPKGKALHFWAIRTTLLNVCIIAPAVHVTARIFTPMIEEEERTTVLESVLRVLIFLILHNFAYYGIHMAMHTRTFYWMHRDHHQFTTLVLPSSANAVSLAEYVVAYMIPPALLLGIVRPTQTELSFGLNTLAVCNVLVHTPCIEDWCARNLPSWWVGTQVHSDHHRRWTTNFASPCFNLDYILQPLFASGQKKAV